MGRPKSANGMYPEGDQFRKEVYDFVDSYWRTNYMSPSIREIRKGLQKDSTSTVYRALLQLTTLGKLVNTNRNTARYYIPAWLPPMIERG